ncbi:protein-disulfide reductase DsbD family protein [Luteimonas sp. RIT-PG2_3]
MIGNTTAGIRRLRPGWQAALAAVLLGLFAPAAIAAIDESDLLPVDEAFALSARAASRDRIELQWKIADGYYLYRHRTSVKAADAGFTAGELQLPDGKRHTDEFFGEVETYRGSLQATLSGNAAAATRQVSVQVRYQGCADLGICYPPQTRTLQVTLPAAGAGDSGFAALGQRLGGGAAARPNALGSRNAQALPLPPEQAFAFEAIVGDGNTVLMRFTPAQGYYLYRDRNSFRVDGAPGISAGSPHWPKGRAHHDEHFGDVTVYFDQVDVPLPLRRQHGDAAKITLQATFQGCQDDGICYPPMTRSVALSIPAGTVESPTQAAAEAAVAAATAVTQSSGDDASPGNTTPDPIVGNATQVADGRPAANTPGPAGDASSDNAARTPPPAPAGGSLLGALILALFGGLVLNLMPCVLPILSLKVLGLAQSGESRARARSHALWYTLGVLAAFAAIGLLVIALRGTGQALGWGFQLQQPWFVAALAYLMFAVGLSLSGVFTLGGGFGNVGHSLASRQGPVGDFFTGVLACIVASPCIAPFMGGALAFAFTASTPVALAVFLALGLGLALPFLLIGFIPALATRLPRPGAWMETLKQVLAFPMYLTAIWLLWILGRQRGVDAMALAAVGLTLLALGLWWHERGRWRESTVARVLAGLVLLAALLPIWKLQQLPPPQASAATTGVDAGHVAYDAAKLQSLRDEGRVVFVNMTADWCVTCKANEGRVLSRPFFAEALRAADATYMVGDWTNIDPQISTFLEQHKAVGVPLYVVYPRGGGDGEVLPAILGEDMLRAALERAAR